MVTNTPEIQQVHEAIFPIIGWLITAAVTYVVSQLIAAYELSRQKGPAPSTPAARPNANGTIIPIIYGTRRVQPVTTWMIKITPVKVTQTTTVLFGLVSVDNVVAYEYKVSAQQVLSWGPTDGIRNIVFGPFRDLAHETLMQPQASGPIVFGVSGVDAARFQPPYGSAAEGAAGGKLEIDLYLPAVYGSQGGIRGRLYFYTGTLQYGADTYLKSLPGPPPFLTQSAFVPSYGDLVHVIYKDFIVGRSPTPPSIDYIVYRRPTNWIEGADSPVVNTRSYPGVNGTNYADGGAGNDWQADDVTPAAVLYDALVNRQYGKGYRASDIDEQSFIDANAQLVDEGLGMSLLLYGNPQPFDTIKSECERTADMVLRRHPETFQWSVKLIRNEAANLGDFNALPLIDETTIRELTWSWRDPRETINEVTITFANAALLYEQDSVTIRNDANIAMTGTIRSLTAEYPGITDRALALKIAARELKAAGLALGHGSMKVTRAAWSLERGDCLRLSFPKYGLSDRIVRVSDVDLGDPSEKDNEITVGVVEDVFHFDDIVASGGADEEPPPVIPRVRTAPVVTATTRTDAGGASTLSISVYDPDLTIESISFRRQEGGTPAGDWEVVETGTPGVDPLGGTYTYDVPLSSLGASAIAYDIAYKQDYDAADADHLTDAVQAPQLPPQPVMVDDGAAGFLFVVDSEGHLIYV